VTIRKSSHEDSMIQKTSISTLQTAQLQKAAQLADSLKGAGNGDGAISTAEVDKAIQILSKTDRFDDVKALATLKTFLVHQGGKDGGQAGPASAGGYSPMGMMASNMTGSAKPVKPAVVLGNPSSPDAASRLFQVPSAQRQIADKQSVLIPLEGQQLHVIELEYQDTRKLRDLEFNYRESGSFDWKTVRGDQYHALVEREKRGEVQIKRESDHNAPWVNNPIRVKVEVLFPDGRVHEVGRKFLDFHVHDAWSADSSGYPETDNISNGYENLPHGKLPEGCMLRLTPSHENRKPWEKDREIAMDISWVKPTYMPDHVERKTVASSSSYGPPKAGGYPVDPNRTIAAVLVNWTDHGGTSSGAVSLTTDKGAFRSNSYNVGSGETELIPVNAKAKDGVFKVEGYGVEVRNIEVLYAD
jgi:hypothetical protein